MALPVIILLLVVYGYTLLVLLFYLEIEKDAALPGDDHKLKSGVSVLIPFRNEENSLPGILEDCARQSYPAELVEILFVDDHSMDDSATIVRAAASEKAQFRYLELPPGMTGKKKAATARRVGQLSVR